MQAAIYHGQRDVRIEEIEPSEMKPTDVRIAVAACGICGTDLHEYAAGPIDTPGDAPHPITGVQVPIRFGHEFGGRITAAGSAVEGVEAGDLVTVNPLLTCGTCRCCAEGNYNTCENIGTIGLSGGDGGFAEQVVVDESHVVLVPETVPAEYTALIEPLAVGVHAVRESDLRLGDDVAIIGGGPIGLATALAAKAEGAGRVLVSASRDSRREIAREIGVDAVIDPNTTDPVSFVRDRSDGGVAVAFEAAGGGESLNQAVQSTERDGDVTVISLFEESIDFDPNPIVHGERTLSGIFGYQAGPLGNRDYRTVIRLLARGEIDPEPLITSRIGLSEIVDGGFERLLDRSSGQVKILVSP
jgi:(R,R)-butanediol dehydrogenase / meso-butanediol dehydrogenase / diacetyl reductase